MSVLSVPLVPQLDAVMSFPMGNVVARYTKDHPKQEPNAALHERELKRYLFLCALHPDRGWPMVSALDELWHTFIIFTKDYHAFSGQLGMPYLHHEPFVDGQDTSAVPAIYQEFLSLYVQQFGEAPVSIWPATLAMKDCGSGCSGGGCSGPGCGSSCGSSCR